LLFLTLLLVSCAKKYVYHKTISFCDKNSQCPVGSVCENSTCERDFNFTNANTTESLYSSYKLPYGNEKLLTIIVSADAFSMNRQDDIVMDAISSELLKYHNFTIIPGNEYSGLYTEDSDNDNLEKSLTMVLNQFSTQIYIKAGLYYSNSNQPSLSLKLIDFRTKKIISSETKSFYSMAILSSNISYLIDRLFSNQQQIN